MSVFETQLLPAIVLGGLCVTIVMGSYWSWRDKHVATRAKALKEATEALMSLYKIATEAGKRNEDEGRDIEAESSYRRAYFYQRAAAIVRSIPVDRL